MKIPVKILNLSQEPHKLPLPKYATEGDDAVDLQACFSLETNKDNTAFWSIVRVYDPHNNYHDIPAYVNEEFILKPHHRALIPTGLKIAMPLGWESQVKPRSGLALKSGIRVMNSPGTVDSPYRGFVGVILINDSEEPFVIKHSDRIAQMALKPSNEYDWKEVHSEDALGATERGEEGFGHTGVRTAMTDAKTIVSSEANSEVQVIASKLSVEDITPQDRLNGSDIETISNA